MTIRAGRTDIGGPPVRDDLVLPFGTVRSRVAGRIVRLGHVIDEILSSHDYPEPISVVLGQAIALTALLGQQLQSGRLILQTKSDGPLGFLVVQYEVPGRLRGYASYDPERLEALRKSGGLSDGSLLGNGRLAMTIDPGGEQESHQGVVPLESRGLADAAITYFRQSEQLPTFIRLTAVRQFVGRSGDAPSRWHWRAGGLIVQHVPAAGGEQKPELTGEAHDASLAGEHDDDWNRVEILAATVEDHELIDPTLAPERLLLRLFHEEGVRVAPIVPLEAKCRCSRERIGAFLEGFPEKERETLREADGAITVKCEFCSTSYRFERDDVIG
ncbi:MAG: Hsp33 family molecular chaperone [Hyphomicrobium sp.]|nr:Hsp33 family molecular chaperone [Hyphomicrobium sp.]